MMAERAPLLGDVEEPREDGLLGGAEGDKKKEDVEDPEAPLVHPKGEVNWTKLQKKLDPQSLQACCCNMICDKNAQKNKDKCCDKSKTTIAFWVVYPTLAAGFIFVNVWLLLLWLNHRHDAIKCEKDLAGWAFISAVTGLAGWFLSITGHVIRMATCCDAAEGAEHKSGAWDTAKFVIFLVTLGFGGLMLVFDIAWTTLGTFGVFDIPHAHSCPADLYDFVKYYVIAYWALLGAVGITVGVLCCIAMSGLMGQVQTLFHEVFVEAKPEVVAAEQKPVAPAAAAPAAGAAVNP